MGIIFVIFVIELQDLDAGKNFQKECMTSAGDLRC